MAALGALVEDLIRAPPAALGAMPLPDSVRQAVVRARGLARGAYRREIKHIRKLLTGADIEAIREVVGKSVHARRRNAARFHRLERWRDRLVEEGDPVLGEFLAQFPAGDRRQLRQFIRDTRRERAAGRPPMAYRALFRYLRDLSAGGGHE